MLIFTGGLGLFISVTFSKKIKEIQKSIQEFPSKLFSFFVNPIFIITIFSIAFLGIIILIFFRCKSRRDYKKWNLEKRERIKRLPKKKIKKFDSNNLVDKDDELNSEEIAEEDNVEGEDSFEPMPIGTYRRSVHIRVDEYKRYFHKKNITKHEVKYLLNKEYQIKKYKNLLNGRMENFLLQPRHNESFTHLFLTKNISEFLEKNGIETELFVTKKPDIVFEIDGKRFAIEIETGSIFSKISRMKEKLEGLKNYDTWFFVVTDRNKVKKYKKYGDAVDKRYVKSRLDKLIKLVKKAQK